MKDALLQQSCRAGAVNTHPATPENRSHPNHCKEGATSIMAATTKAPPSRGVVLKLGDVAELLGVSVYTARRYMNAGTMPAPIFPPPAVPRWRRSDIMDWLRVSS